VQLSGRHAAGAAGRQLLPRAGRSLAPRPPRRLDAQRRRAERLPERGQGAGARLLPRLRAAPAADGRRAAGVGVGAVPAKERGLIRAVFFAQWRQLLRVPWAFLAMIVMSVIMASVVGYQAVSSLPVTVLPEAGMSATQVDAWLARLGASSAFEFEVGEERAALERLASSGAGLVLRLGEASWTVLAAPDDESAPALAAFVGRVYREELALRAAAEGGDVDALRAAVEARLATPALRVVTSEVAAQDDFAYDSRTQAVFG